MGLEGLAIGLTVASGAMQAFGAYSQGVAQQRAEEYNAEVARQEGEAAKQASGVEAYKIRRQMRTMRAKQEALYAKAGVAYSGSPLEVMLDTESGYQFDLLVNDYNTKVAVARANSKANYYEYLGKASYNEGLIKAGTTLLNTSTTLGMMGAGGGGSTIQGGQGGRTIQTSQFGRTWSPY